MRSKERFLVTGCMGCLGAWAIRLLVDEGARVVGLDLSSDRRRLQLLLTDEQLARVSFRAVDITVPEALARVVREEGITHVLHFAGLQVPFCRANPPLGSQVNVTGTVSVFEAVRANADQVQGLAYASSAAVFGPPELYDGRVGDDARQAPATLYGVYKQANESTARVYAAEHGLSSVGLRPFIAYGPGRDAGLTASASTAMLAAAAGVRYRIEYGGRSVFQYAPDVARAFVVAARSRPRGAETLNLGGAMASVEALVEAIEAAVPEARGTIGALGDPIPVPFDVDASGFDRLAGGFRYTSLQEGVERSVTAFRELLRRGLVQPPAQLPAGVAQ